MVSPIRGRSLFGHDFGLAVLSLRSSSFGMRWPSTPALNVILISVCFQKVGSTPMRKLQAPEVNAGPEKQYDVSFDGTEIADT